VKEAPDREGRACIRRARIRRASVQQAILSGNHPLDLAGPWEHGDNDAAPLGDLPRRVGDVGSVLRRPCGLGPALALVRLWATSPWLARKRFYSDERGVCRIYD
jgi:hypothetical protein